jgi:copper transport protein
MIHLRLKVFILCFWLVLFAALLAWTQAARAHAAYERSEPAADAVLPAAPAEVHIWFTEELFRRAGANVIEVSGPDGSRVDQGETRIDDDDRTHALVSLQPELSDGLYTVRWRSLSVDDGHEGSGEFSFTVNSGAVESMPQASPTAGPQPVAAPTQAASTPSAPAAPGIGGLGCSTGMLLGGLLLLGTVSGRNRRRAR